MKITELMRNNSWYNKLYIYPIKSLRPLPVSRTRLLPEGLEFDRRFMLLKVLAEGAYKNIQTAYFPECTLFEQSIEKDSREIIVKYHIPKDVSGNGDGPLIVPIPAAQLRTLRVPLYPKTEGLGLVDIKLFGSSTSAYRMGDPYDAWFTECMGYGAILVYIGDERRAAMAPPPNERHSDQSRQQHISSWFSSITSYISGSGRRDSQRQKEKDPLVFNEVAPFLITSRASLHDVSRRLPEGVEMDMIKFRPNIVVDEGSADSYLDRNGDDITGGKEEPLKAWEEDYWAELLIRGRGRKNDIEYGHRLAMTANCGRCISINIDYETGRTAKGELGVVLKKLMVDRRVDSGSKYSPIFGRYAFLLEDSKGLVSSGRQSKDVDDQDDHGVEIAVGDEVIITKRMVDRDVWRAPQVQ